MREAMDHFRPLPALKELEPEIQPFEFQCLVLQAELADRTRGGLILPDEAKEREEIAGTEGLLVRVGGLAFTDAEGAVPEDAPQIGERVLFERYAGALCWGADGRKYRIMPDKKIIGVRK